ncbi:hypothetical protein B566_EDAN006078 [Ephemera danica]|nr:hypothetical protein B566_EDAN006078 [Ephemera danica]
MIEALNGPSNTPRPVVNSPLAPAAAAVVAVAGTPDTEMSPAAQAAEALNRSGLDSKGPSRPGEMREKGSSPSSEDLNLAPEFRMSVLLNREQEAGSVSKDNSGRTSPLLPPAKRPSKKERTFRPRDTVLVVNEMSETGDQSEGEPDSEAEKMSPLLDASTSTDPIVQNSAGNSPRGEKVPSLPPSPTHPGSLLAQVPAPTAADDSDYYTPDDQGPGILLDSDKPETRPGAPSISAGNTPVRAPGTPLSAATSHRSSGDSFSSSSSTRQLLPPVVIASNGTAGSHTTPEASVSLQDVAMV